MNRSQRRRIIAGTRGMTAMQKVERYTYAARLELTGPLSSTEIELERRAVAWAKGKAMYHGGAPGLAVGAHLVPAMVAGADPKGEGLEYKPRLENVFVTTCPQMTCRYAKTIPGGTVYEVVPEDPMGVDPVYLRAAQLCGSDSSLRSRIGFYDVMTAFTCSRATISAVLHSKE